MFRWTRAIRAYGHAGKRKNHIPEVRLGVQTALGTGWRLDAFYLELQGSELVLAQLYSSDSLR